MDQNIQNKNLFLTNIYLGLLSIKEKNALNWILNPDIVKLNKKFTSEPDCFKKLISQSSFTNQAILKIIKKYSEIHEISFIVHELTESDIITTKIKSSVGHLKKHRIYITNNMILPYRRQKKSKISNYTLSPEIVTMKQISYERNICVLDLESILDPRVIDEVWSNGQKRKSQVHIPFLLCYKTNIDEKIHEKYSLNCIQDFIPTLMKMKNCDIFAHNGNGYDYYFLMKKLFEMNYYPELVMGFNSICYSDIKSKSNRSVGIKSRKRSYIGSFEGVNSRAAHDFSRSSMFNDIKFKDSYKLFPNNLRKLCELNNIELPKTYFPYWFPDQNNFDNYLGPVPKVRYWVSDEERSKFLTQNNILSSEATSSQTSVQSFEGVNSRAAHDFSQSSVGSNAHDFSQSSGSPDLFDLKKISSEY